MDKGVLSIFGPEKKLTPALLFPAAVGPEESPNLLIQTLRLAIGLGMVSGTQTDVDAELFTQRPPHPGVCMAVGDPLRGINLHALENRSTTTITVVNPPELGLDLQHALGHFAAECEAAGMRISTSKSEAMVLDRKKVACTLQVGGEVLPQVEEFKYLGVLFTSEGRMDHEIDRRIGAAAAVMRSMYRSVVVKKELSRKAKLSIYQSIYAPTLTYGHELWVMTKRVRSRIQATEMSFLRRVAGRSLRDRVRSSVT
ncbi:hypothetical protein QTP70_011802 [Hemibagrus guttatus]|uniref:Reverse transcriptase domain-containing protein n=1 Tax=Hemibagrus guttatus TaxID=175788 RepID=A0AAE0V021_9TELE|nr:hypothetical protein QTP70_011802 [Hemibagrus guttatus]